LQIWCSHIWSILQFLYSHNHVQVDSICILVGLCSDSLGTFFCFALPAAHTSHGFQLPVNNQPYSRAALQVVSLSQCPRKSCAFMIGIFAPVVVAASPVSMLCLK
jgi:hypothetical protein